MAIINRKQKALPIKYNDKGSYIEYNESTNISFVEEYGHSIIQHETTDGEALEKIVKVKKDRILINPDLYSLPERSKLESVLEYDKLLYPFPHTQILYEAILEAANPQGFDEFYKDVAHTTPEYIIFDGVCEFFNNSAKIVRNEDSISFYDNHPDSLRQIVSSTIDIEVLDRLLNKNEISGRSTPCLRVYEDPIAYDNLTVRISGGGLIIYKDEPYVKHVEFNKHENDYKDYEIPDYLRQKIFKSNISSLRSLNDSPILELLKYIPNIEFEYAKEFLDESGIGYFDGNRVDHYSGIQIDKITGNLMIYGKDLINNSQRKLSIISMYPDDFKNIFNILINKRR